MKDNMRIIVCEFGGLGERDIVNALKGMGHSVTEYNRKCNNYDTDMKYLDGLAGEIERNQPDIVFSINYLPIVSKVCNVYKILYYAWVYDCPEMHLYSKSIANPINRIFIFDKVMYERLYKRSPETVFYLPLATEPVRDFDNWLSDTERKKYSHDVAFIGSMYNEKKRQYHQLDELPEYEKGFIQGLARAQMNVYGYNLIYDSLSEDMTRRIKKQLDYAAIDDYDIDDREIIADHYIGVYASSVDRIRTLQAITDVHKLSIYTDSDISMLKNVEACGVADSITMTPKIFHCSKININITIKTIQSGIPLRVFDVLGAGGFLITNYQPEIPEYFVPGEDLVMYESIEDLQDKILYYLEHDEERENIAAHGYQTIVDNYTYDKLLAIMFDGLK